MKLYALRGIGFVLIFSSQFDFKIGDITIITEFRDWVLQALRKMTNKEIEESSCIQHSQSRALLAGRTVRRANQNASRDLISDEYYIVQREQLAGNVQRFQEQLRDTEERAGKLIELAENVFEFAAIARKRFQ